MENKEGLSTKIKTGLGNLKSHWKTPPDGYYVNYKEFLCLAVGCFVCNSDYVLRFV